MIAKKQKFFLFLGGSFLFILALTTGTGLYIPHYYQGRLLPNITIGNREVGAYTTEETRVRIASRIDELLAQGFTIRVGSTATQIPASILAPEDPDLSRDLVVINQTSPIAGASAIGHHKNPFLNVRDYLIARTKGFHFAVPITLNDEDLHSVLESHFSNLLLPTRDASFTFAWSPQVGGKILTVVPALSGTRIDTKTVISSIKTSLSELISPDITLSVIPNPPLIRSVEAETLLPKARASLAKGDWTFRMDDRSLTMTPEAFSNFLTIRHDEQGESALGVGGAAFDTFLDSLDASVRRPPHDAKFTIINDRVTEFELPSNGKMLDRKATVALFIQTLETNAEHALILPLKIITPHNVLGSANNLGIETKLGVGVSNFKGSPANRIKNIQNGARLLHGTLVAPDTEFSLLAALAPFTTENGYLPELVIKGTQIIPELGGGLCQIGTTTFRTTMNSGLPITERANHSLVVSYYNDPSNGKPGTDATIYSPAPDFKFKNDTGAYILITTAVDIPNKQLIFTFWGKDDGRHGSYSPPVVDHWKPAGDPVSIPAPDFPVGTEKCQAVHPGADTHFTYSILHADGSQTDRLFTSHYRALPKTCLVGTMLPTPPTAIPPINTAPVEPISTEKLVQ